MAASAAFRQRQRTDRHPDHSAPAQHRALVPQTPPRNAEFPSDVRASIDEATAAANALHTQSNGKHRSPKWPGKSDLYIFRTDGMSCARETVEASGCLSFGHPSSQQLLL
ncbi:hypothetical protein WJX73_007382, partial [Symbiochloris irregularis]